MQTTRHSGPSPSTARRVILQEPPFSDQRSGTWDALTWPASWISGIDEASQTPGPLDVLYRLTFSLDAPINVRLHVSADERYDLRLNGVRVGRGPQRGDLRHWSFESYDVTLEAGQHLLWAWVSSPGRADHLAPSSQLSRRHGLLVAAESKSPERLNTGQAAWEAHRVTGVQHVTSPLNDARLAGGTQHLDARAIDWDAFDGRGTAWHPAHVTEAAQADGPPWGELDAIRALVPARLPAMMDAPFTGGQVRYVGHSAEPVDLATHDTEEAERWQAMLDDTDGRHGVTIPPNTRRTVLLDWPDYVCAYPSVTLRDGRDAEVRLDWAEALHVEPEPWSNRKAHRDAIDGLIFRGRGDAFIADGQRRTFEPLWWRAGRYTLLTVQTGAQSLEVSAVTLRETRYPLAVEPLPELDDSDLQACLPILKRGLLMSMHEHYADSPYYEQLQYVGDTRLESLCTHLLSPDDRLPRRAIELFGWSRLASGLTQARYPSSSPQIIPGFSLYWVAMLHDLARWRGQRAFVAEFMPAARSVLEAFIAAIDDQPQSPTHGLPRNLPGWNFLDWVPAWPEGIPPPGPSGHNAAFAWQLVYTLRLAAELEDWLEQPELAKRDRRFADSIARACDRVFFDDARSLYADTPEHDSFSQHAQCFAILSNALPRQRSAALMEATLNDPSLHEATIYFSHYLFEALAVTGRDDDLHRRFDLWRRLPGQGFKCAPEAPEPTRSDCHGWGSHPLYHVAANVVGVRPTGFGFQAVRITPHLGPMRFVRANVAHPQGPIRVSLERVGERLRADIQLPPAIAGHLVWGGQTVELHSGSQRVEC